ncbi:hypothetical protein N7448_008161 [Penicillium atrosanguineum]|uniref:Uncharacterized protein n=1 Tax=Penicillium atrosanguineum TaxID=1132637 RepID=A0A9W9KYS2_9EURO|nr:uncharacterized protein N7443_000825 [Penicillium atrosanguineum]KAJ5127382.1 hypothetical protein N7448_008161 [Penicillium atrosanguineum]KAJ5147584.1 hypothetical protein N7526_000936 [Penicillium atrosanguineum]KAJ5313941.1 hypothetical protein N7443_000825 [Penicillium atrosanguineum]KAJ5331111.1 hypothetical protein N7476_000894 [Penicillium atrosanguineum]
MRFFHLAALTLASTLGAHAQCDGVSNVGNSCYEYPDGCPSSSFLYPAGSCKERIQLVGNYNCCCGCPGKVTEYHHCVIEFHSEALLNYKTPGNLVGFCQDDRFYTRIDSELLTKQNCEDAQLAIAKKMTEFYQEKSGQKSKFFTPIKGGGKVKTYPAGNKAWVYKIWEGIEQVEGFKNITPSCQGNKKQSLVAAQCALEKNNACFGVMGKRFHASTDTFYKAEHGVEIPKWPGSGY